MHGGERVRASAAAASRCRSSAGSGSGTSSAARRAPRRRPARTVFAAISSRSRIDRREVGGRARLAEVVRADVEPEAAELPAQAHVQCPGRSRSASQGWLNHEALIGAVPSTIRAATARCAGRAAGASRRSAPRRRRRPPRRGAARRSPPRRAAALVAPRPVLEHVADGLEPEPRRASAAASRRRPGASRAARRAAPAGAPAGSSATPGAGPGPQRPSVDGRVSSSAPRGGGSIPTGADVILAAGAAAGRSGRPQAPRRSAAAPCGGRAGGRS